MARVTLTLSALGWRWMRVNGSTVAHLVPGSVLPLSRTACNRLPVFDATIELPAGRLGDVKMCHACAAYGARGGRP